MTVAEALSNLVFAAITDLRDVKCSGNWMWAAKLPGEGKANENKRHPRLYFSLCDDDVTFRLGNTAIS